MQGQVLHFDATAGLGVLRGEDGQRYRFSASEWKSAEGPATGAAVDFEISDGRAIELFCLAPAPQASALTLDFSKLKKNLNDASSLARQATLSAASEIGRRSSSSTASGQTAVPILKDQGLLFAVASLAICAIPLVSLPMSSFSLYGASAFLGQSLDQLHQVSAMMGNLGQGGNPWSSAARSFAPDMPIGSMTFVLTLAYLVYAVPLAAATVVMASWRQSPRTNVAAVIHASTCFVPLCVMVLAIIVLPKTVPTMFGAQPMPSPASFAGAGVWLLAILGGVQFAALRGLFGNPVSSLSARSA